ncbi:hypothetical protein B0A55_10042 [Friedmanniomyces simplex]|uniref:Uncharacterized protein n=1 Tax=Friedmanniomyces simplex TaxID=329884 RepID=A0A4U0XMH6_9PEZI|nr:hypothetical protein B0A55_10042 [Friedmanniomyces simplex]
MLPGQSSFMTLISRQWDTRLRPRNIVVVPGLFLNQEPLNVDVSAVRRILQDANPAALGILASALQYRDNDVRSKLRDSQSNDADVQNLGLWAMAEFASLDGREGSIARDMSMLEVQAMDGLYTAIEGRYGQARRAIAAARQLRIMQQQQVARADIVTGYLAAVCDMAGPEDEDE